MLSRSSIVVATGIAIGTLGAGQASASMTEEAARQAAESLSAQFNAAYNRHDAAAIAALFSPDGTFLPVKPSPSLGAVITGRPAIERFFSDGFKTFDTQSAKVVEAHPVGDSELFMIEELHLTGRDAQGPLRLDGHVGGLLVRTGGQWQLLMTVANGSASRAPGETGSSGAGR